ncbi:MULTISPECIES: hypothetical protein [Microvirga]|uniref:hypothetical protein n=1 Tax=Microvirga TaxID=186650 RepID=UPI0021CA680B|nr:MULTISPECIES: hypothetical protein [unclassified Microvirga]
MLEVMATDGRSHQDRDAVSLEMEDRAALAMEEAVAPVVLNAEDLAWAAGGLLTRKVNEYEGQHR